MGLTNVIEEEEEEEERECSIPPTPTDKSGSCQRRKRESALPQLTYSNGYN